MRELFGKMTISSRLLVSSLAFALPIALLLYFTIIGINYSIRFNELETLGNAYQRPLETLLRLIPERQALALRYAAGDKSLRPAIAEKDGSIDQGFAELAAVQARIGADLQFDAASLAKRKRDALLPEKVQGRWSALKSALDSQDAASASRDHEALTTDVRAMISHSGDTSNLILDPDLDSYYTMDLTLLALPQTQERLAKIMAYGAEVLTGSELTQDQRVRFAVFAAMLTESDIDRIKASTDTALKEDANFLGISPSFQSAMPPALAEYVAANETFADMLRDLAKPDSVPVPLETFLSSGSRARETSFRFWDVAAREMDVLLHKRIDDYAARRTTYLAATGAALLLAGLLVYFISVGITRPLDRIRRYSDKVAEGDLSARLEGRFSGELRKLADDIAAMVGQLKIKLGFAEGILSGLTLPCVVADPQGRISYLNNYILHMLDKKGAGTEYLGRHINDFFAAQPEIATMIGQTLSESRLVTNSDYEGTSTSGDRYFVKIDVAPIYDLDHQSLGAIAVFAVLTQLKVQEAQLAEHNAKLAQVATEAEVIAKRVSEAVDDLSAQIEQTGRGASVQKTRAVETATAMEQMNASVLEVARTASQAASHAEATRGKAQDGARVVGQAIGAISRVAEVSSSLRDKMASLGEQAKSIDRIMNVISDIADQTNLLALNAAIEAARAGEAGRGFAVVADEVRKLAEKTMLATKEVGEAVRSIQAGTVANLDSVAEAVSAVGEATALAERSGAALKEIVGHIDAASDQVRGIAAASEEQSSASEEISRAVDDVAGISGETARGMENSARAVTSLAEQSRRLAALIRAMQV